MDNKIVFVRTGKGEGEIGGGTGLLFGDARRALLMVDGSASFGEIRKRAAPSLRDALGDLFKELERGGFIQDKARAVNAPRLVVPSKPARSPVQDNGEELDFTSMARAPEALTVSPATADESRSTDRVPAPDGESHEQSGPDERSGVQEEAAGAGSVRETNDALHRDEMAQSAHETAPPLRAGKARPGVALPARSTSATVLFLDVVGYTRQPVKQQIKIREQFNQLLSECLDAQADGEYLLLDTGDGAAVGFMQHPEVALDVAVQFRKALVAHDHEDYPLLNVRIGIHLGPVNVVRDMNGQSNMVGDGINDAQRVMSFAGTDRIYVSRPYYDFVSRLSDEYADLFQYRGSQRDKHGREHPVYELLDAREPAAENAHVAAHDAMPEIRLEPFSFSAFEPVAAAFAQTPSEPAAPQAGEGGEAQSSALMPDGSDAFVEPEAPPLQAAEDARPRQTPAVQAPVAAASDEPVAQARAPGKSEAMKFAEKQSGAWPETGPRAAESNEADKRATSRKAGESAGDARPRARRRPLPWGKISAGLFVSLLAALFAVPHWLPTRGYADHWEHLLGAKLGQTVQIGGFAGRLLPTPQVVLSEVSVGEAKQFQVRQVRVKFSPSALFSSIKPVDGIELEGVRLDGAATAQTAAWLQRLAADTRHPVARIALTQGRLETDGVQLSGIGGEVGFDGAGRFSRARLSAEGDKYGLDIVAASGDELQVLIKVRRAALPLLPNWPFDELEARGELSADGLRISEWAGRIMGGTLLGDANLAWRSGWRAEGALTARDIGLNNLSKLLEGELGGSGRFDMRAPSLPALTDTAKFGGAFAVRKGALYGVDIVETARLRSRATLPGGRTHFDLLSGDLSYQNGVYRFERLSLDGGVLNANGAVSVNGRAVSGTISARLSIRAEAGAIPLQLGGTTESLSLHAVR